MNHQSETAKSKSTPKPHLFHSWMNPSCEKRSTSCGHGLVARERIPSGSLIFIQGGHVTPITGTGSISEEIWDFPIQITTNSRLAPRIHMRSKTRISSITAAIPTLVERADFLGRNA